MSKYNVPSIFNNDIFNSFISAFDKDGQTGISNFVPLVNTREGDYAYHIELDLPGVKKEDISIHNDGDVITISGERKFSKETKKEDYYHVESSYGKYQRRFTLPKDVDVENIDAKYVDGVLEVVVPKLKRAEAKKIEVK